MDALTDPGSKGFAFIDADDMPIGVVLVRGGHQVYGYLNVCPHNRIPLDFVPDQFLSQDQTHILCATHGALFDIQSGACVSGPCKGQGLTPIAVQMVENMVYVGDVPDGF
jgi:nitrite reductase/ring-hydroxylating ferredoxin subunit